METEVKIQIPNYKNYKTLISLFAPYYVKTLYQRNNYFDGVSGELSDSRAVLLIRSYNNQSVRKCFICLKAKALLVNGVSRLEEDTEDIDPSTGQECVFDPTRLVDLSKSSRIMKRVKNEFFGGKIDGLGFKGLGGFKNMRKVYEWNGLKIEVDKSSYKFGTLYEIECESSEPEKAKELIEVFLKENGIEYSDSVASKFNIFRTGKLPKLVS
ncbi:triphosphate tunnel metalloenzyme 3-like [Rutidosis leptorrhynchoides]|uniref:triphosphate tunnel metalloenzyme 3-like n=1 Tax=Rutidosis leptorrhynchoides TaxID=125765 RepID=UPI003A99BA2B